MKKLQGEVQEMQPELVAVMRGCISNSYQIFTPSFLFLPQNPSKTSWDPEDKGEPPHCGKFGAQVILWLQMKRLALDSNHPAPYGCL